MGTGGKRAGAQGAALAVRLGAGMALFVFGGYLIDRLLETEPAFLLAGTLLGAMMVIFDLVRRTRAGVGGGKKGVD